MNEAKCQKLNVERRRWFLIHWSGIQTYDSGIIMRGEGMERAVVIDAALLAMSKRAPVRQPMGHVQGGHPKQNGNEYDCWDED